MEQRIIAAAVKDKSCFDLAERYDYYKTLSDKGKIIWKELRTYYELDPDTAFSDVDVLRVRIGRAYPHNNESLLGLLSDLDLEVSTANFAYDLQEERRHATLMELSDEALGCYNRNKKTKRLEELFSQLQEIELEDEPTTPDTEEATLYRSEDFGSLVTSVYSGNRISLAPDSLNKMLEGGVERQRHVLVFGRPEVGKTSYVLNLVHEFLRQKLNVLYIGNEDPPAAVLVRLLQRIYYKAPRQRILDNIDKAIDNSEQLQHFYLHNFATGTLGEIERSLEEVEADVVVVDQLRNLTTSSDNRVLELEEISRGLRSIAKRHDCVVISVTQAGESASGRVSLDMGDVDYSNTGVQGAVDLMIGIGANSDMIASGHRVLSFPKNKISGTKEDLRVVFDTNKCLVHD